MGWLGSTCAYGLATVAVLGAFVASALALPAAHPFAPPTQPATIAVVRSSDPSCAGLCSDWIAIEGAIGPGSAKRFAATLGRLNGRKLPVLIESPGGLVREAVEIGRLIRSQGLDVGVGRTALANCPTDRYSCAKPAPPGMAIGSTVSGPALCASACSFILAGGVRRFVPFQAYVGVHQFRTLRAMVQMVRTFRIVTRKVNGEIVEVSRTLVAERKIPRGNVQVVTPEARYDDAQLYFSEMGISPKLMDLAEQTAPTSIHWLSLAELASTRMDTEGRDGAYMIAHAGEPARPPASTLANEPVPSTASGAQVIAPPPLPHQIEEATLSADGSPDWGALRVDGWVTWSIDQTQASPALLGIAELSDGAGEVEVRIEDRGSRPGTPDYRIEVLLRPGRDSPFRHPLAATLPAVQVTPLQPPVELQAIATTLSRGFYRFDLPTQNDETETERLLMKRAIAFDFGLIVYPERTLHLSLTCGKSGEQAFRRWRELVDQQLLAG